MRVGLGLLLLCAGASVMAQSVDVAGVLTYRPPAAFKRDPSTTGRIAFFGPQLGSYAPSVIISIHNAGKHTATSIGREAAATMARQSDMKVLAAKQAKVAGKAGFTIRVQVDIGAGGAILQHHAYVVHRRKLVIFTLSSPKSASATLDPKFQKSLDAIRWRS